MGPNLQTAVASPAVRPPTSDHVAELERLQHENQRLRGENQHLRARLQRGLGILGNDKLTAGERITLAFTTIEIEAARPKSLADQAIPISISRVAREAGLSPDSVGKHIKRLAEYGAWEREVTRCVDPITGKVETEIRLSPLAAYERPCDLKPATPKKWGGRRTTCSECGADALVEQTRVVCRACGTIHSERERLVNAPVETDPQDAARVKDTTAELQAAARYLAELAGDKPRHIEMQPRGEDKYQWRFGRVTSGLTARHLQRTLTIGATLARTDGTTYGLCFDADTGETWALLQQATRALGEAGAAAVLERSPAGRGGHLWLFFVEPVNAEAARATVLTHAPQLSSLDEHWPRPTQGLRLPAGRYRRPGVDAWCEMALAGADEWYTGLAAMQLVLAARMPASWVQALPTELPDVAREDGSSPPAFLANISTYNQRGGATDRQDAARATGAPRSSVSPDSPPDDTPPQFPEAFSDPQCRAKCGDTAWFAFTPQQVAAWFNEQHSCRDLLPREANGYGLATWRGERTASVYYTPEGGWVDYGAGGRRDDGKPDAGDAFELFCRITGGTRSDVLRGVARDMLNTARIELEAAAREGHPIPGWVEAMLTPAGWLRYRELAPALPRPTTVDALKVLKLVREGHVDEARQHIASQPDVDWLHERQLMAA